MPHNIYQLAREAAGITQERAAELIGIASETMRAYEYGKRRPPDDVVVKMVDIYDARYLAYQHLKASAPGQMVLPELTVRDLPTAVLRLLKEVHDFAQCRDELVAIAADGVIDQAERPVFDLIMKELKEIEAAVMSLEFSEGGARDDVRGNKSVPERNAYCK